MDPDAWLRIEYRSTEEVLIDRILVYNRKDCCQDRIVGAAIEITADIGGLDVLWAAEFETLQLSSYDWVDLINEQKERGTSASL